MARVFETVNVPAHRLIEANCDRCGGSCVKGDMGKLGLNVESGKFSASWGYYSNHDCTSWSAELCEPCCEAFREWVAAAGGAIIEESY